MAWPPVTHADTQSRVAAIRALVGGSPAVAWPPTTHTAVVTEINSLRTALGRTSSTGWPPTLHGHVVTELDALWTLANAVPPSEALAYPANAGHINVKNHGVVGNGTTDDTAAIQALLNQYDWKDADGSHEQWDRSCPIILYFPPGTYRLTAQLWAQGSSIMIKGAGEGLTTLKLDNNLAAFQTGTNCLLRLGEAGTNSQENAGFANFVHDITLDIGSGNVAAVGCRYSVANSGSMRHVTIQSSDATKRGKYGLMVGSTAGPGWVADVKVVGFDYGIWTEGNSVNNITLSGVTLDAQRIRSVGHGAKSLAFEDLTLTNAPSPAIEVTNAAATLYVDGLNATAAGSGTLLNLTTTAYAWVRDVVASGWTNLITQNGTTRFSGRTSITEWGAVNYRRGDTSVAWGENSPYVGLHLARTRAPEYEQRDLTKWKCPQDFGYTSGNVGPTLQQAIDSGAEVVYLPYGEYPLTSDVVVRGAVRLFEGMFSGLAKGTGGRFTVGNSSGGHAIIVRNLSPVTLTFEHAGAGPVVFSDIANNNGVTLPTVVTLDTARTATLPGGATVALNPAVGNLFYESAGALQRFEINRPINAWLRQINREHADGIISNGATVRIFGDNIEIGTSGSGVPDGQASISITDSTMELIGAAFDSLGRVGIFSSATAFNAIDSNIAIVTGGYLRSGATIDRWVRDTKNGTLVGSIVGSAGTTTTAYLPTTGSDHREVVQMYVSPAPAEASVFPWALPNRATLAATGKDVLAYFHTIPSYWRVNSNAYAGYILPSSSPTIGGRWRQRPYPIVDNTGLTDTLRRQYAKADIAEAAAIGIDGFTMNVLAVAALGPEAWRWTEHIIPHYDAAAEFSNENTPGFKICPNISMLNVSIVNASANAMADAIQELLKHPAAYKRDNRPVVMLYNVDDRPASWYQDFHSRLLNTYQINASLIPSHQASSPTLMDNYDALWDANIFTALHPWNIPAYTVEPNSMYTSWRTYCAGRGVPFVGTCGPAWENDRPNERKQREGFGLVNMQNQWQSSINAGDTMFQITSWNDHEESHNIKPCTGYQYVPYDITAYYLAWFKTGTAPTITRDAIYYSHRMHLGGADFDPTKQTANDKGEIEYDITGGPAVDRVITTVFLTAAADVIVTTGGVDRTHTAASGGLFTFDDPMFANDVAKFKIRRGGVDVLPQFSSVFPTRSIIEWQDLLYRMGSSTRPPLPAGILQSNLPQDRD
jgi:hypothetical protein